MRVSYVVLLLVLAASCTRAGEERQGPPPATVEVAQARQASVPVTVEAIGTVQARSVVEVKSQVEGQVAAILFREGDRVEAGAPLFEIDRRPFELALRTAQAALGRAREQAVLAEREAERAQVLERQGAAATQLVQQREAARATAQADVRSAQAAVEAAALELEWTRIAAPLGGRTGSVEVDVGDLVQANGEQPMVTIRETQPIEVRFTVPATELPRIRERVAGGAPVEVLALEQGSAAQPVAGHLTFVDNAIDEASGTIALQATFGNEDERLWPGAFVNVQMRLGTIEGAVVVPSVAVQRGQEGEYVFVVGADDRVQQRPVRTGARTDDLVQITRGVKPGEAVVTEGQLRLFPGAVAQVRPAKTDEERPARNPELEADGAPPEPSAAPAPEPAPGPEGGADAP